MQFVSVLRLVCGFMKLRFPSPFLCYYDSFFTLHWKQQKKPISHHQHWRAKLRARCLLSSWHVLPIDGSVITVACRGHIMAASDSHHSGPVSCKYWMRGGGGVYPLLSYARRFLVRETRQETAKYSTWRVLQRGDRLKGIKQEGKCPR